jgi:hypothetical protein
MAKIIGTPTVTPAPKPDWNQTDPTKADYIKNKPDIPKEEWITIADITTTEEVSSFDFSKDQNGNAIECKLVMSKTVFPSSRSEATSVAFYVFCKDSATSTYANLGKDRTILENISNVMAPGVVLLCASAGVGNDWDQTVGTSCWRVRQKDGLNYIDRVQIQVNGSWTFPVGTQVKVWGLKA